MIPAEQRVTVVIVTFNSAAVIGPCLTALGPAPHLVVVDNASGDGTLAAARSAAPNARLIALPANAGFGSAANRGLAEAATEFGLVLNADTVARPGLIPALIAAADRYPDAGLLAPCSWDADGRLQFGRVPVLTPRPAGPEHAQPDGDCCAAYAGGAAFLFRLAAFRAIGGFDERLFLYYEDDDLCLRLRRAGWSLIHVADAHLDHAAGRSTAGVADLEWWKQWHMAWSRLYLERKYRGRWRAWAAGASALPKLAARAAGRRNRARYRGRLAGTWAFLTGAPARAIPSA